jgi:hypothetical protein
VRIAEFVAIAAEALEAERPPVTEVPGWIWRVVAVGKSLLARFCSSIRSFAPHQGPGMFFKSTIRCSVVLRAENLHPAEMGFERHDQSRVIDLREQDILNVSKSDQVDHEIVALAIGHDGVKLDVRLAINVVRPHGADADHVESV